MVHHIIWYRHGVGDVWHCIPRSTFGHTYSRPADWLTNAESQMRGDHDT